MDLQKALSISARGMNVQTTRLRVIAENLANQDTTGTSPNTQPYRRKTVTFANAVDKSVGAEMVKVKKVGRDMGDLPLRFDPGHPAADERGYVRVPNVNSFVEVMDLKEAQRSYSANLNVLQVSRGMISRTIEMLR
jgi:flagellar basal-body rod protein FlgC